MRCLGVLGRYIVLVRGMSFFFSCFGDCETFLERDGFADDMIVVCSSVVRRDWGRRCMSSVMSTQTRIGRMCGGRRISRRATWHGFEGWLLQMFPYIPFSLGNGEALDGRGLEGEAGERGGSR